MATATATTPTRTTTKVVSRTPSSSSAKDDDMDKNKLGAVSGGNNIETNHHQGEENTHETRTRARTRPSCKDVDYCCRAIHKKLSGEQCMMILTLCVFGLITFIIVFGEWVLLPSSTLDWCSAAIIQAQQPEEGTVDSSSSNNNNRHLYPNPDSPTDPCYYERTMYLLGWNKFECDFGRRMLYAVILGACVGFERRSADRPAGIRTMSLVSLGAAIFTLGGQFAFRSSTQTWDAARVSAAIPSGVGFLGSALIWKETTGNKESQRNHVHGITTATSVWLSASVGIAAGGALWVTSAWTVILVVFVLRLGPKLAMVDDQSYVSGNQSAGTEGDWTADDPEDNDDDEVNDNNNNDDDNNNNNNNNEKTIDQYLDQGEHDYELLKKLSSRQQNLRNYISRSIRAQQKQAVNFHSD